MLTDLENQITILVMDNQYLDTPEKANYIASMLLMSPENQKELFKKIKKYDERCKTIEKGHFTVTKKEVGIIKTVFKSIKERLFLKTKLT